MNDRELAQLHKLSLSQSRFGVPKQFDAVTVKVFAEILRSEDYAEAVNALMALFVEKPGQVIVAAEIKQKLEEGRGAVTDPEILLSAVIRWLEADAARSRYWDDWEQNYGLDRWVEEPVPAVQSQLPLSILKLIDDFGGPDEMYRKLVLGGDSVLRAQFKKALTSVPSVSTVQTKALKSASDAERNAIEG